jgi:arylsulfatase A-like enzyme
LFATPPRSAEQQEEGDVGVVGKPPASNGPYSGGKGGLREGGVRLPAFVNWPKELEPRVVDEPLHHVDVMPTLLSLVGGKGNPHKPFDGIDATATLRDGAASPHEDVLINVEVFRGAIRKGDWKLIKKAVLPSKTELFDLFKDPGESENLAEQRPEIARDLEARLERYASEQQMSLWLKAQVDFIGLQQGDTVLDPGYRLDGGLPSEVPVLPDEE